MPVWIIRLFLIASLLYNGPAPAQTERPRVRDLRILTTSLALYDRFELRFDLTTRATDLNLPFDPIPPAGLEQVSGVSADALFTSPSRKTYTQPAFFYQPYRHTSIDNKDHRIPSGAPYWLVRFTPQEEGLWQVRIRATDSGGMTLSPGGPALTFTVRGQSDNPYRRRGFLRVSPNDRRYFEFQDGATFIPSGFNTGMGTRAEVTARMASFEQNKVNFVRTWMSSEGINGSQWSPWASFHLSYDGYIPGISLEPAGAYPGHELAFRLDSNNPCLFQGWQQGPVSVEPGVSYTLTARVKLIGVTSASSAGGFVIKTGGWLGKECAQAGTGVTVTPPAQGSRDWFEVSGSITPSGPFLDNLYMVLQSASGTALVDEVRLYRQDDPYQINVLRQPAADSHLNYDPYGADKWDYVMEAAERHGVYLKLVIDEKNEWIRNRIGADGRFTAEGDNNNFYAAPGSKGRWLQQAWWRYVIARWGYSTAIHSIEYINEGDPYNGNHYEAANALATYIHQRDPSHHLVTTSFWSSFPGHEFWTNPAYAEIDYADIHAYLSTGWGGGNAAFLGKLQPETDPKHLYQGRPAVRIDRQFNDRQSIAPRGLALRGKGEWIVRYWLKADRFRARCSYDTTGSALRVRWTVDGGTYAGGKEGVVPFNREGKDFICTSPDGTFDWRQMRSDLDRDSRPLPEQVRLIIPDDLPHEIHLYIENYDSTGGQAWISGVELVSPSGQVTPVIGQFDATAFREDTAWYNAAYGLLLGGGSPVGAGKPLVRGETGLDDPETGTWSADLNRDRQGIWLHHNVWAGVGPGGMVDLMWWTGETIFENERTGRVPGLLPVFVPYQNFMAGISLSNGRYQDARAGVSDARLRAWGQRDDSAGRAHLWIQNRAHTWQAAVAGKTPPAVSASIILPDFPTGSYTVEWWDTYATANQVIKTERVTTSEGSLTLTLPTPLQTDIAVRVTR